MQLWRITVFFLGCLAALAASASGKPRQDSAKLEKLFLRQIKKDNKIKKKMKCRPTFRKVNVLDMLVERQPDIVKEIMYGAHYEPKTMLVPSCSDSCTHCRMFRGKKQKCVASKEKNKTFYIQYGRRELKYYAHKEKVAKGCECR